jgi:outer membrane protein
MRHLRQLSFAALNLFSICALATESPPKQISVEDAKSYAIKNNFGIQSLKADVIAQEAAVTSARSAFFPRLGVAGGLDVEGSAGERESAPIGFVYGRYNLFNGFSDQNEVRKTEVLKELSESKYEQAVNKLKLEVEDLFYDYLLKKRFLAYYAESVELNSKHLKSVQKRKASGLSSESDLMDFELRDSLLNSEINRTKQELSEIKLNLVRRMGPELGLAFEPSGDLPHWHLDGSVDSYLSQVKDKSEVVRQASLASRNALASLKVARAGWLPKIDAEVRFGALPLADRFNDQGTSYSAGIVASWDLFSGFQTRAEGQKAEAELMREELNAKQVLLESMAEVETSIRKLQSITQRVDIEVSNESRAEKLYRSTLAEFGRGVKNGADVKTAEESWLEAKMRRSELKSEFIKTKIYVEKAFNIPVKITELADKHN